MNETQTQTRTVVVEREIAHPPEKIWRALTQPHLIEEWLMKTDFMPVVGHRFNLRGEWGGVLDCEVLTIEPNRTLAYRWDFSHEDAAYDLKSVVTMTLTPPKASSSRLRSRARTGSSEASAAAGSSITATSSIPPRSHRQLFLSRHQHLSVLSHLSPTTYGKPQLPHWCRSLLRDQPFGAAGAAPNG